MFSQKNFGLRRKKNHVPALISGLVQNISALGFAIICRVRNVMQLRAHYSVTHHIVHPNIHPGSLFQFLHNSNTLMILGTNHQHRTLIHKHLRTLTHALSNLRHLATDAPRESYRFFRRYTTHTQSSSNRQASPTAPPHSRNTNHVFSQFIPHPSEPAGK
jgi:hypothetical protein